MPQHDNKHIITADTFHVGVASKALKKVKDIYGKKSVVFQGAQTVHDFAKQKGWIQHKTKFIIYDDYGNKAFEISTSKTNVFVTKYEVYENTLHQYGKVFKAWQKVDMLFSVVEKIASIALGTAIRLPFRLAGQEVKVIEPSKCYSCSTTSTRDLKQKSITPSWLCSQPSSCAGGHQSYPNLKPTPSYGVPNGMNYAPCPSPGLLYNTNTYSSAPQPTYVTPPYPYINYVPAPSWQTPVSKPTNAQYYSHPGYTFTFSSTNGGSHYSFHFSSANC